MSSGGTAAKVNAVSTGYAVETLAPASHDPIVFNSELEKQTDAMQRQIVARG